MSSIGSANINENNRVPFDIHRIYAAEIQKDHLFLSYSCYLEPHCHIAVFPIYWGT